MKTVRISLGETEYQEQHYDPRGVKLKPGDQVVVETKWGQGLARVLATFPMYPSQKAAEPLPAVLRVATTRDRANEERIRRLEVEGKASCLRKITERELPMKLVDVKASFDRSRVTFYFYADERIDFRELVKELAQQLHTRIEMRQIRARDVASKLGCVGPCGRQLCCKTFLKEYEPISVRMAKDQGLPLNPSKLAGMCGRLKCCLRYEHSMYEELKRRLPKVGSPVEAPEGVGIVKARNILTESVVVELEDGAQITVKAADLIHIGPPLDENSPRNSCGGGGCSSGGCGVDVAPNRDHS
ncbi:regulatory iron-sulfur-containing complex subunit RicT [Candidatus Methylomirabilis sp.]|uniref:PSP1 domain-containing protein n=1 Tax=Candidatus Methylomirabilis sp. TaxID=2032687 RepID=UPI002A5DEC9A|nr:regulatory iron-sulfur-containing complex subunit RicT [Candidatus Methylomirabilis sp.]